jgi:hypothetical protein
MIIKSNKHQPANPRRSFLRMAAGFGAVTAGAGLLAACGGGGDDASREGAQTRIINGCASKAGAVVDSAGMTIGFIDVVNDATNVYIQVFSANNAICFLRDIKLWVGTALATLPVDGAGAPRFADLPWKQSYSGSEVTHEFVIPLASIGVTPAMLSCAGTPPSIFVVGQLTTNCATGTVRGYTSPNSTATYNYASYPLCCADVPPVVLTGCETAFAKGGYVFVTDAKANPESLPTLGLSKNRWGWAINLRATGTTTYPIYAGAGLNNTGAGKLVGTLTVNYTGSQVTASYAMAAGAAMSEAHLYVGDLKPTTIAPGQFGNKAGFATPATSHSVSAAVSDSNGDGIWLIAHAVVCGR